MLTDYKARRILDGSKSYMRSGNYDEAVTYIIDEIYETVRPKTAEEIKDEQDRTQKIKNLDSTLFRILFGAASMLIGFKIISMLLGAGVEAWDRHVFRKRSKYDYDKPDKLTPKDDDFVDNNTWTVERLAKFHDDDWLNRSQHSYRGSDKLYPGQLHFKMNPSWTTERIREYDERLEREERAKKERDRRIAEDKLRRSKYDYAGSDKLYPDDYNFVNNATWTALLVSEYLSTKRQQHHDDWWPSSGSPYHPSSDSSSSDSSWSSSDWGGSGFDGGGASSSW